MTLQPPPAGQLPRRMTLNDFKPFGVVKTASWGTRECAYPVGVRLAYLCHQIRMTPNQVSALSLFTGVASAAFTAFVHPISWIGWIVLMAGLQLAYMLDCADGVLARATGRCSDFGAILDKTLDSMAIILIPGTLCVGARLFHNLPSGWDELPPGWVGLVIMFYVTPRISMAMVMWLKDYVQSGGDKTKVDERQRTFFWRMARVVAFLVDTPVCRFFLAISWMTGYFFPYLLCYGAFSWLAFGIYMLKSRSELSQKPETVILEMKPIHNS